MEIVAVANAKGGTGKTSTAVCLAGAWGEAGVRTLLVDLDPQASATDWLGPVRDDGRPFGAALIEEAQGGGQEAADLLDLVQETTFPNLERITAGRWLGTAERELRAVAGGEVDVLRRLLAKLPSRWGVLVLDCPPAQQELVVQALTAATHIVLPVEAAPLPMRGVLSLMERVGRIQTGPNPDLKVLAIVPCRVTRTVAARQVIESLRQRYGDLVTTATIRENARMREAPSYGQPVTAFDPDGLAAQDVRALATELGARLGLAVPTHG
ncbi:MAG TPA: ParA family protein [Candidatus Dormibacteraeota bacterium]|jgi:chromosome partitioning protein